MQGIESWRNPRRLKAQPRGEPEASRRLISNWSEKVRIGGSGERSSIEIRQPALSSLRGIGAAARIEVRPGAALDRFHRGERVILIDCGGRLEVEEIEDVCPNAQGIRCRKAVSQREVGVYVMNPGQAARGASGEDEGLGGAIDVVAPQIVQRGPGSADVRGADGEAGGRVEPELL